MMANMPLCMLMLVQATTSHSIHASYAAQTEIRSKLQQPATKNAKSSPWSKKIVEDVVVEGPERGSGRRIRQRKGKMLKKVEEERWEWEERERMSKEKEE
ncbi:hypothetical protein BDQ17DRAFT_1413103, partial [Cyathus striatus]